MTATGPKRKESRTDKVFLAPLRVLVVEDSEDDTLLLLRELKRGGYEPIHERVETPEAMGEALADESWDVVISDYRMPRFGAMEALTMLRGAGSEAPFVIVSGKIGEDIAVEAMKAGAHDYIMKDNLTRLCATVRRGLEEAQALRERRRAVEALREREEQYRGIFEETSDGLLINDPKTGKIVEANPAACRMHGYTCEEFLTLSPEEFIHPDYLHLFPEYLRTVKEGGEFRAQVMDRRKDGTFFHVEVHGTGFTYRGEPHVLGVLRDVTERKRAEEELEESQRTLSTLMSNLPGMAYRCRNDKDWTMELVSEGCSELTGYPPGDLAGNRRVSYGDLVHPDDREAVWEKVQAALGERRPFQCTYRITTISGATKWVWEQGQGVFSPEGTLLALEGFITDQTERVLSRRLLEQRAASLTRIAASLTIDQPMEDTLSSLATSVVRASTGGACSVALIDEESETVRVAGLHGLPDGLAEALEASWRAGARSPALRAFHDREPRLIRDARRLLLDDPLYAPAHPFLRQLPWETALILPLVYQGRALGTISVYYPPEPEPGEDEVTFLGAVADQAAIVVENARLFTTAQGKAALEERQRLARELHDSVSQALYGIALGARTARTLLDRDPSRVAEPLDYVLSLAEAGLAEMRALIFELRPESLATEGLVAALEKQASALRARHQTEVRATLAGEPDAPLKIKEALYRIAQEALHNTVKHARAGNVELKLENGAGGITLEVRDDGAGFDPAGSFPGHLGLKSMRERAARLGGTLEVESTPGQGTRIRAQLPVSLP